MGGGAVRGGAVPKRTAARATDWTPAMTALFTETLADSCNVTLSARAVGRSVSSVIVTGGAMRAFALAGTRRWRSVIRGWR